MNEFTIETVGDQQEVKVTAITELHHHGSSDHNSLHHSDMDVL